MIESVFYIEIYRMWDVHRECDTIRGGVCWYVNWVEMMTAYGNLLKDGWMDEYGC